jgi:hypothetical protein
MSNTTFRPFLEKLGGTPANTFIGNNGELFYDPDTTKIRVSDGVTPGGKLIAPAFVNYFDFSSESVTLPPVGTETPWPTYIKLASVTSSTFSRNGLVHVSNNRVTNTSTTSKVVKLEAILSFIPDQTDFINVGAAFFQGNGDDTPIIIPCSEQKGLAGISAQNEITVLPFHCVTELETGDYVEVWVQNLTDETGIKLDNINVIITEF